jgi:alkanesulfonate monooxygenase SsuD/methylene tetrahydromethanopterin reductase-like flavin-dependent oxidoreductase (luciferase family)
MKFDLIYEMQTLAPHGERSEYDSYWQALAQIELADQVGFDTIWAVEHHFLNEYSHSSAPEVFLAAVAQRTQRIRIGHGVALLPYPFNHPIRVAERVGALDILSNGRVEFGTGRSSRYEQRGFGIDPDESRAMWEEAIRIVPRMWQEDPFSYEGTYFDIPERSIIPKPIQKPHPPIWVASTSSDSWAAAARMGIGVLGLTLFVQVDEVATRVAAYRQAVRGATPVGAFVNDQVATFTIAHCAESLDRAIANGAGDAAVWYMLYAFKVLALQGAPGAPTPQPYGDLLEKYPLVAKAAAGTVQFEDLDAADVVIVGDPERCIRKLDAYRRADIDRVVCLMQAGRIPHDAIMESIRLFGEHVIPHFRRE